MTIQDRELGKNIWMLNTILKVFFIFYFCCFLNVHLSVPETGLGNPIFRFHFFQHSIKIQKLFFLLFDFLRNQTEGRDLKARLEKGEAYDFRWIFMQDALIRWHP